MVYPYPRFTSIVKPSVVPTKELSRYLFPSITIITAYTMNKSPRPVGEGAPEAG